MKLFENFSTVVIGFSELTMLFLAVSQQLSYRTSSHEFYNYFSCYVSFADMRLTITKVKPKITSNVAPTHLIYSQTQVARATDITGAAPRRWHYVLCKSIQ